MQEGEATNLSGDGHVPGELMCPQGRVSRSTFVQDDRRIIDFTTYIPFFLVAVNNALSAGSSRLYREKYGIGIVDWRIFAMLAAEPNIPATRICDHIALDKGAVSRALKALAKRGYLNSKLCERDSRVRRWTISEKGYELYDEVIEIAVAREENLIRGISPNDLEAFLHVMRQMQRNLLDM